MFASLCGVADYAAIPPDFDQFMSTGGLSKITQLDVRAEGI
jgi:hypothetical protein